MHPIGCSGGAPDWTLPRVPSRFARPPERWPSGLRSATGNRVGGASCLVGSNPTLSAHPLTVQTHERACNAANKRRLATPAHNETGSTPVAANAADRSQDR
jgi:hypothetical protein